MSSTQEQHMASRINSALASHLEGFGLDEALFIEDSDDTESVVPISSMKITQVAHGKNGSLIIYASGVTERPDGLPAAERNIKIRLTINVEEDRERSIEYVRSSVPHEYGSERGSHTVVEPFVA